MSRSLLAEQLLKMTPQEGEWRTMSPQLRLYRMDQLSNHAHIVYEPALCVIVQGSKQVRIGDLCFGYDAHQFLLTGIPMPAEVIISRPAEEPFLGLILEFDLHEVVRVMLDVTDAGGVFSESHSETCQGVFLSTITDELLDALHRLLVNASDALRYQLLYPGSLREVLFLLLTGQGSRTLRELIAPNSAMFQVLRSARYIDQHCEESLDIASLAKMACMSQSSYYDKFRRVTSLTPVQYIKRIRLHRARLLLASAKNVAETAVAVGYNSPSQFSRDFRKVYGMSPSQFQLRRDHNIHPSLPS